MRLIIRTIILVAILWIGVLLSGYGVLFHSEENVGGLGLKCQYLTARGVSTALYVPFRQRSDRRQQLPLCCVKAQPWLITASIEPAIAT